MTLDMSPHRWARIALGYLTLVGLQIGVWAMIAPQSFYDSFPGLGRTWVSVDGPFNEHLVRDVGALNLALAGLYIVTWIKMERSLLTVSGVATLIWGVPHLLYHLANTDVLDASDVIASLSGLALMVLLGGGLVWAARSAQTTETTQPTRAKQ